MFNRKIVDHFLIVFGAVSCANYCSHEPGMGDLRGSLLELALELPELDLQLGSLFPSMRW